MKKITVTKDGKVTFDGKEVIKKDINSALICTLCQGLSKKRP